MSLPIAEHIAALTDPQLWQDNPLAMRDARRDTRRNRIFIAVLTLCLTLLFLGGLGAYNLYELLKATWQVPNWLGGDLATALAIGVTGIHFWWVARAAQRRVDGMLMKEAALDGLTSLLMLPMSRLQLVLQAALYPWITAASIALLLLPVYVFCVALEGMTWAELFSLYTLFALASIVTPGFRSPALSGNVGSKMLNQSVEDPHSEPDGDASFLQKRGVKNKLTAMTTVAAVPGYLILIVFISFSSTGLNQTLGRYIPASILALVPSAIISLPFMLVRALIAPFAWFQWHLAPMPFVISGVLLWKYLLLIRTSEFLSVGQYRDLASLPSYLPRRRVLATLYVAISIVVIGYLWPWVVRDEGAAFLTSNPTGRGAGFQGFLFLSVFCATAWALVRSGSVGIWGSVFKKRSSSDPDSPDYDPTPRTVTVLSSIRYIAMPMVYIGGIVLVCGVFGGQGLPAGKDLAILGKCFAVALAAIVMNIGFRRLTGPTGVLGCLATALPLCGPRAFVWLIYFSPMLGFINIGPRQMVGLNTPNGPLFGAAGYERWVLVEGGIGLVLCAVAWVVERVAHNSRGPSASDTSQLDFADAPVFDPTLLGREVFADAQLARKMATSRDDSALSVAILRGIENVVDNAVVSRDIRARLRNRISAQKLWMVLILTIVACLVVGNWFPFLAQPGEVFSDNLDRYGQQGTALQTLSNLQGCFLIVLMITAITSGYSVLPRAFGMDKRKNTLSFLLTTPMSTRSIVVGKAFSLLFTTSAPILYSVICSFVFCFPLSIISGNPEVFTRWALYAGSGVTLYVCTSMIMLALGSLFPNLTAVRLNGCIRLVVLYFVFVAFSLFLSWLGIVASLWGVGRDGIWTIVFALALLLIMLSIMITIGAINGMRKGDIDIKLARK